MKHLIIFCLALSLQACGVSRMFSGESSKTAVTDAQGNVVTNRFGLPVYNTVTKSKSAGIYDGAARMIEALPPEVSGQAEACSGITFAQLTQLAPSAQKAFGDCLTTAEANKPIQIMGAALTMALTKYQSTAHAIAAEATLAVQAIQQAAVDKWNAVGSFGKFGIGVYNAQKYASNASRDRARVAQSGAENAGDILANVNTSSDFNDSGNAAASGADDVEDMTPDGNGTGESISNVIVGRGINNYEINTRDNASAFVDSSNGQILQPGSTGGVNNDSNIVPQPVIDGNVESNLNNNPTNGSNNSLF
jgi:hypothetical protein